MWRSVRCRGVGTAAVGFTHFVSNYPRLHPRAPDCWDGANEDPIVTHGVCACIACALSVPQTHHRHVPWPTHCRKHALFCCPLRGGRKGRRRHRIRQFGAARDSQPRDALLAKAAASPCHIHGNAF
eukprot:5404381-Prymnesium_polylepis.2